ncbi:MAG: SDR family NAD(P)-dependent oxidoreductase [Burkholderiales bacterium]|nr:SDR family NAD(P)-dependent oxidoreductase [Burkholderiales bacterium]
MRYDGDLRGHTVVITGASSGIGRAAAHAFAREGAQVVLAARGRQALQEVDADRGAPARDPGQPAGPHARRACGAARLHRPGLRHADQHHLAGCLGAGALCHGLFGQQVRAARLLGGAERGALGLAAHPRVRHLPRLRRHAGHAPCGQLHRRHGACGAAAGLARGGGAGDGQGGQVAAARGDHRRLGPGGARRPCAGATPVGLDRGTRHGPPRPPRRAGAPHGRQPVCAQRAGGRVRRLPARGPPARGAQAAGARPGRRAAGRRGAQLVDGAARRGSLMRAGAAGRCRPSRLRPAAAACGAACG